MMETTEERLLTALEELCAAYRDSMRRHLAGDPRAIESNLLRATYEEAQRVIQSTKDAVHPIKEQQKP